MSMTRDELIHAVKKLYSREACALIRRETGMDNRHGDVEKFEREARAAVPVYSKKDW